MRTLLVLIVMMPGLVAAQPFSQSMAQSMAWMKVSDLSGTQGLAQVYADVAAGTLPADQGIVIKM